jgi:hypothetical protein
MLWYKNWLETRSKLCLALILMVFPLVLTNRSNPQRTHGSLAVLQGAVGFLPILWALVPILLAGSGIKTQTFRAQRGLHSSMFYTLSMPVSRLRLFATRTGIGILEFVVLLAGAPFALLLMLPALRPYVTNSDLLKYWVVLFVCGLLFYSISALLSTFLDDLLQTWTSMFAIGILFAALSESRVPALLNVFRAMGADSPLFTHTLPWATMGVAIVGAAILFSVASVVVRGREY